MLSKQLRSYLAALKHEVTVTYLRAKGVPRVALASFPRSGNTWLRRLIEEATKERSGSIYDDRVMPRSPEGIVIKTHALDSRRYTKAIHLIRDPFDAIESFYAWRRSIGKERDLAWEHHVAEATDQWARHTQHWLNTPRPTLHVRFEDFKVDTAGQLRRVINWLSRSVSAQEIEHAIEACRLEKARRETPKIGKDFYRKGKAGEGIEAFTSDQQQMVHERAGSLLEACGYS